MQLLERHFGAAISEAGRQQMDIAKQHAATITATLNAVNAYAEWAPLPDLAKYGIISGYVSFFALLSSISNYLNSWHIIIHWFSLSCLPFGQLPTVVVSCCLLQISVFMLVSSSNLSPQGMLCFSSGRLALVTLDLLSDKAIKQNNF